MKTLLPLSIACALSLAACSDRAAQDAAADTPPADTAMASTPRSTQPPIGDMAGTPAASDALQHGDGFALGLLATIDQHEIDVAKQARDKKVDGDVLAYADMMEKDHGTNLQQTQSLGPSMDDPAIAEMKTRGTRELDMLAGKSGKDYAKAYIDAMVKGHQDALDAIDSKMMPAATRDDVKQHLTDTRKAVEMHLAKAKEIAATL